MNKFFKVVFAVAATLFLGGVGFVSYEIYNLNHIDLGQVVWRNDGDNNSSLILKSNGAFLIDNAGIDLWGKYPYIYGCYHKTPELPATYFIVDLSSRAIELKKIDRTYYLHELKKRGLDWERPTTYWSLKGQWGDKKLLERLQTNLKCGAK
ncbi:MAG: hypothetical protein IJI37_07570 [Opitutales bacterium]|nr:hypothetical protein [Opitutales bacterium]